MVLFTYIFRHVPMTHTYPFSHILCVPTASLTFCSILGMHLLSLNCQKETPLFQGETMTLFSGLWQERAAEILNAQDNNNVRFQSCQSLVVTSKMQCVFSYVFSNVNQDPDLTRPSPTDTTSNPKENTVTANAPQKGKVGSYKHLVGR